jgi:hypothetical protein
MPGPMVIKRAFSEPLLLLAALGSILLATTALVALTMYATTIAEVGVRRTMETASIGTASVTVGSPVTARNHAAIDASVRREISKAYGGAPAEITTSIGSDSYTMPGQEGRKTPELLRFGSYQGLDRHARILSGAWPSGSGDVVEAVISAPAASATGFQVGQTITTRGRVDGKPVRVRITGVFQLDDPFSPRFAQEQLLGRGVQTGSFTTYGPLMVEQSTFLRHFATSVGASWLSVPDLRAVSPEGLAPIAARVAGLAEELKRAGCPGCVSASRLPDMLTQLGTAALVSRSTMLIPVLQLLLLSAYALTLTARLLADHRRMEVALLRSRGAGTWRLVWLAGGEALLVALPCALVAPFLCPPLLALVDSLPWIRSSGVRLAPEPDLGAFLVSAGVSLAAAVLLVLPAVAGARRTYVEEQATRGRGGGRGLLQRAGADVALLVVAGLAVWQLQHYGAPVTATAGGELGIDPLIVTGPALALLAGGMLGLRLVPRISRLAERFTSRRRSLAPALGAWQVARRPLKYAGPALLLTMAIAIGIVSLSTAATWRLSQDDQARHLAGADLRLTGPSESAELGALGRGTAFATLPGVRAAAPGYRGTTEFGGDDVTLLSLPAESLAGTVHLRQDLSEQSLAAMARTMAGERPAVGGIPLPGRPARLELDASTGGGVKPLRVVLSDVYGVWHQADATAGRPGRLTVDLRALAGRGGRLGYPLTLRGLVNPTADDGGRPFYRVTAVRADGTALTPPAGQRWATVTGGDGVELRSTGEKYGVGLLVSAAVRDTDVFAPPRAPGAVVNKRLPVVITANLAERLKLSIGQVQPITLDRQVVEIVVAGVVERMPTTGGGDRAVLVDWSGMQARALLSGMRQQPATEWWLSTAGGPTAPAREALRVHPQWDAAVVDRQRLAVELRDDPLASGLQGALILGFLAALVFAALGFLVNAAVAARERTAEFTVLRALGVSFRQLFGLLAIEQTFVIGLSLAAGTLLAVAVGYLVVPHIVLTGQATAVTPGVLLDIPWPATIAMLAGVALLLFGIVAALARGMRGQALGQVLRNGEGP